MMSTLLVHTRDDDQLNALEVFLRDLKIPFEKVEGDQSTYNPEFVAKIEKSLKQANDGEVVKIALDDISK